MRSKVLKSLTARGTLLDISKKIAELKKDPGFTENVGMILVHNGTVRRWSRNDRSPVNRIDVSCDQKKIKKICTEAEQLPGIYKVVAEANSGTLKAGDDQMFLIVAGDIRENVKPALCRGLQSLKP